MKRKFIMLTVASLLGTSLQVQAQSLGDDPFIQANNLMKSGNCEDARKAITLYNRAKKADVNLRSDCDKRIQKCQAIIKKGCSVSLELSTDMVEIPYQGGDYQVGIISPQSWKIIGAQEWLNTTSFDKNSFVLQCRDANNSTRERVSILEVRSGDKYKTLKVVQAARKEYIEVDATSLSFPPKGATEVIGIESNARWDVSSVPSWCKAEKGDSTLRITVLPNDRATERVDDISIVSPNKSVSIKIKQGAREEHLTLSQNDITVPAEGGKHYLKVYTDATNWFMGDFPTWINVERVGQDSICIVSEKNIPNGQTRSGSVQIKTDKQTVGVMVTQAPREAVDIIFPNEKIVSGRNLSFGVSASYYVPFVNTSAGGNYVGSVVDYSLGNGSENASYKSATGYSLGLFADLRIYKNIFIMAGVNFTQIKYKNKFNLPTTYTMPHNNYQYLKGMVENSYKEEYSHTMLEIPILASYRFKLNNVSHMQLNFGPVLNIGLSAKMKLRGNTDSNQMVLYDRYTNQASPDENRYFSRHTGATADFNLYRPCVLWTESYTTGNMADVKHHDDFSDSPLHRVNWGLRAGVAYEVAGLSFGVYYTLMLSNMANKGYWEDDKRWTVLNNSDQVMTGYKQRIHTLEFKLAYTLRYLGKKKNQ